jgi:hypothetical protein
MKDPANTVGKQRPDAARQQRLAEQLRSNLRKRKEQARRARDNASESPPRAENERRND